MMEAWRGTGDSRVASPIIYKAQRRLALQYRFGTERRPESHGGVVGSSDPMIETGVPSTEEATLAHRVVPAPPGVVMVAPPEVPRNTHPG